MRRHPNHRTVLIATLVAAVTGVGLSASAANGKSSCETCHSKIAATFAEGTHASGHVTCVDCHGGNPADMTARAMSAKFGFTQKPSRAQIPEFCSRCHSDAGLMKQYGLPSHQFEDYKLSGHGQAWARGDGNVAVCTDCHGGHGMRAVDDTNSTVYRANVAKTCAKCHADAKLMARYGLAGDVYAAYEKSTHANLLKAGGRLAAPSCPQCHGSHNALPPRIGGVQNVCGQCHGAIAELVFDNPHAAATKAGHFGQCISCHGNHAILPPTLSMLSSTCAKCHAQDSRAAQLGVKLEQIVSRAQARHAQAEEHIDHLAELAADVEKYQARLDEASTTLKQIATHQHVLSLARTEQDTVTVESISDEINGDATEYLRTLKMRRLSLVPIWGYILFSLGLLYWKRRRLGERTAQRPAASAGQDGG